MTKGTTMDFDFSEIRKGDWVSFEAHGKLGVHEGVVTNVSERSMTVKLDGYDSRFMGIRFESIDSISCFRKDI